METKKARSGIVEKIEGDTAFVRMDDTGELEKGKLI
jgi:hypothetical protein